MESFELSDHFIRPPPKVTLKFSNTTPVISFNHNQSESGWKEVLVRAKKKSYKKFIHSTGKVVYSRLAKIRFENELRQSPTSLNNTPTTSSHSAAVANPSSNPSSDSRPSILHELVVETARPSKRHAPTSRRVQ
jgi:hypothetical protein